MYMEGYIMTKAIIKNLRYKYILIYCSMVLVITFLVEVENIDIFDAVRLFLGGFSNNRFILIMAFIACLVFIQYINVDIILLFLKNNTYFVFRYKSRTTLIYQLFKNILLQDIVFLGLLILAFGTSTFICDISFIQYNNLEILEFCLRGGITYIGCSIIQIALMIKFDETNTFLILFVLGTLKGFM